MLLLTDGRVLCQDAGGPFSANGTGHWNTLTPDKHGSYINGTWNQVADGPNKPQFFASAVLNNGRVFVAGGEYNGSDAEAELLAAEIYDPVTNTWVSLPLPTELGLVPVWMSPSPLNGPAGGWNRGIDSFTAADVDGDGEVEIVIANNADDWTGVLKMQNAVLPGWTKIGDAPSCVLTDGRLLLGSSDDSTTATAIFDPTNNTWAIAGANGIKGDPSSEETWTFLRDGTVLTVQCSVPGGAEKYVPSIDAWKPAGSTPEILPQPCPGYVPEIGPAILLPDGRVFAVGASGGTALYTPPPAPPVGNPWDQGSWTPGPLFVVEAPTSSVITAADVDGDGEVEIVIANNADDWTGVLKWQGGALVPVWMSPSPLNGPAGGWNRGIDSFTAADVDGDGEVEIVIANNADDWTGVLKWQGGALVPVWMSPSPLNGPAGGWNRGIDSFTAADVDGDGEVEIVIANNADDWTGVLKWQGGALVPVWMSPSPLNGPAGGWNRGIDSFTAADVDGDGEVEIVIANNADDWTGVLKWQGGALVPVWMSPSPLNGPAGGWNRGIDSFTAADVDGDGEVEIVIANNADDWTGVLKWQGGALVPVWMSPSPLNGPAGGWNRGIDSFTAADVDGDGEVEIVIANNADDWTGVLKWQGGALVPVWMSPSPLNGPAGGWNRGIDSFTAADVDGDGEVEIVIANNADDWTGVLKWQGGALVPVWMRPTLNVTFAMDAPACLLPNGRVLCAASPGPQCKYPGPTHFAEYDPDANVFLPVPDPPNNGNPVYYGRLLLLPTGEVLFSNSSTDLLGNGNIQVYRSDGHPRRDWKPVIYRRSLPHKITRGTTTTVTGIRFNGLSQAVSYGDDAQMATNYPLARLHHRKTGTVVYCRTANHSTMAVATGDAVVSTNFTVPATALPGPSNLVIVANGIPSRPVRVVIVSLDVV